MRKPDRPNSGAIFRCAIYTRKSSDEGLEQAFNSLDAQREACEAYIVSQRHAGWTALPDMYDDGGLSGGTMERPALQRLLSDIKAGKVQIIVVYKVDRLTRSLADFAKIVDVLDAYSASFVSVTQQFNTTTSMGRLTLNMLLSFAQFEREIAGERIRDKIAASKAKGMWMGGNVPLGYDVKDRKLIVNETEAATVRMVFRRYAELGSVSLLEAELGRDGIVSKRREGAGGALSGGKRLSRGALYLMLQNRLYRGEVAHKDQIYPGQHEAVIDPELWQIVQDKLAANRQERSLAVGAEVPSLLASLIFDSDGACLSPTHAVKKGKRYRYYVSTALITGSRTDYPKGRRIPAGDIEGLVLDWLRAFFASGEEMSAAIAPLGLDAATQRALLDRSAKLAERWTTLGSLELRELVRALVQQIRIDDVQILVWLNRTALVSSVMLDAPSRPTDCMPPIEPLVLSITASLRRAGKGVRLVIGNGAAKAIDGGLASLIARAIATRNMLLAGRDDSIDAMASRLGVRRDYLAVLVRLSYLSPEIVRAIVAGEQPIALTPTRLVALSRNLPHDWQEQRRLLGFSPA
jgi:DNA invertase Pin-like site-specific DNA recombinase